MGNKQFEQHLSRRVLTENGWEFFCRICGEYKPEHEFYNSNKTKWGIDTKCKMHYGKKDEDDDGEMDYLKLNPIKESDFIEVQTILEKMGYKFGPDEPTVHEQFMERHKDFFENSPKKILFREMTPEQKREYWKKNNMLKRKNK